MKSNSEFKYDTCLNILFIIKFYVLDCYIKLAINLFSKDKINF
jgi:hypothetical protein